MLAAVTTIPTSGATDDENAVGRRLRQAREQTGMYRREVADAVGASETSVKFWEEGRPDGHGGKVYPIPYRQLQSLAELYNVTPGWLLHGEENAGRDHQLDLIHTELQTIARQLAEVLNRLDMTS